MPRKRSITFVLFIILLFAGISNAVAVKLYRWVDDEGTIHYTDQIPAEHAKSARSELSDQGLEIRHTDAAKSGAELAREKELELKRQEQQQLIEKQRFRDRVLLRTFRTEDDLLMARDGKLTAIEVIIQITRSNIRRNKERLTEMQKNAASLERQGRPLSSNLIKDIEGTRQQLRSSYASIIQRERGKEAIRNKAISDLKRFRALKHMAPAREDELQLKSGHATLLDTLVICDSTTTCDKAWKNVETYLRKHATTRLQMLTSAIIMTAAPLKDHDISLTASRIPREEQPGAELFLDLQCKNSPIGQDLCKSDIVEIIRTGFRPFLLGKRPF